MRVPDALQRCVVFVGTIGPGKRGEEVYTPRGTAFFLSMPSTIPGTSFVYLATAAHVAEQLNGATTFVRLNRKDGGVIVARFGDKARWYYHPNDDFADVAVMPWVKMPGADYQHIPVDMFATEEIIAREGIGPGDEVCMVGLYTRAYGERRNLPIVRTGNIAMLPEDKVYLKWASKRSIEPTAPTPAYLIEARSIGGISGSPVFVLKGFWEGFKEDASSRTIQPSGLNSRLFFLGLVHGHWDIKAEADSGGGPVVDIVGYSKKEMLNEGIAIIVPAKTILETLDQPELAAKRMRDEQQRRIENAPTPDIAPDVASEQREMDKGITREEFEEALKRASRRKPPQSDEETS
jgi:hypothetical protein